MPVWFEVIVLMLVAYGTGIAIGWGIWGRSNVNGVDDDMRNNIREDNE